MTKPSTSKEGRLTAERVRELFHYDPDTGVFTRRVTRQGLNARAGDIAGTRKPNGYLSIWICGANHAAHRLAWLYVHGTWPEAWDHCSRNYAAWRSWQDWIASLSTEQRASVRRASEATATGSTPKPPASSSRRPSEIPCAA